MKIKLTQNWLDGRRVQSAGTVVKVSKSMGKWLIANGKGEAHSLKQENPVMSDKSMTPKRRRK